MADLEFRSPIRKLVGMVGMGAWGTWAWGQLLTLDVSVKCQELTPNPSGWRSW